MEMKGSGLFFFFLTVVFMAFLYSFFFENAKNWGLSCEARVVGCLLPLEQRELLPHAFCNYKFTLAHFLENYEGQRKCPKQKQGAL
jgi:hypothetical protein